MKASTKAIRFLETLAIPEGPKAGELIKLAPLQKQFVKGALADAQFYQCDKFVVGGQNGFVQVTSMNGWRSEPDKN